jgi:hypothetical protein
MARIRQKIDATGYLRVPLLVDELGPGVWAGALPTDPLGLLVGDWFEPLTGFMPVLPTIFP